MKSFHNIYVLGGHKLSLQYAEKIHAAKLHNRLSYQNLYCVSENPTEEMVSFCSSSKQASHIHSTPAHFIVDYYLNPNHNPQDTLIPDHTAKHVMLQVILELIKREFPNFNVKLTPIINNFAPPFLYKSENDAVWAMSYATWPCPPECDEPDTCPHLKAKRDWDFFKSLPEAFPSDESSRLISFGCTILIDELAHIPLSLITKNLQSLTKQIKHSQKPKNYLIATHSHCHGILGQFTLE